MKRISCLLYQHIQHVRWIKWNGEKRLLRTAVVSSPTSTNVVKLRSNRCDSLVPSSSVVKGKSWRKKLEYAAACYQANTKDALSVVVSLAREDCEKGTSTANRLLYLAMDMALNQDRVDVAEEMYKLLPRRVHVLATSLKIRLFVRQKRFWDALQEVEKVLNEDTTSLDVSMKISKSVMDEFYEALSTRDDAFDEAKRLFTLQRLLSKYNKRTRKSLHELLLSDMYIPSGKNSMKSNLKIDGDILDKIMEQVPEVLTNNKTV
uniref:TPR_REGION domain-containing protein n=1 Tax=Elaeophora elaphi TaxID=1147741 RepID=A0A0R3S472_9BILA